MASFIGYRFFISGRMNPGACILDAFGHGSVCEAFRGPLRLLHIYDVASIFLVSILRETDNIILAEVFAILDFNHHQGNNAWVFHAVRSIHGNVG